LTPSFKLIKRKRSRRSVDRLFTSSVDDAFTNIPVPHAAIVANSCLYRAGNAD